MSYMEPPQCSLTLHSKEARSHTQSFCNFSPLQLSLCLPCKNALNKIGEESKYPGIKSARLLRELAE